MSRPKKQSFLPVFSIPRGKWVIEIPASVSGKRSQRFFSSQGEALEFAATIAKGIESGSEIHIPESKTQGGNTIATMGAAYLSERKKETSAGNYKNLSWAISALVEKFGKIPPEELSPKMVNSWVKSLPFTTRGKFNAFAACHTFYAWPLMRDIVSINPFRDPPPKKEKGHRLDILTPEEMKIILSMNLPDFFKAWIVAGGFAGIRSVEISRISYESIDWKHKEIVIKKEQSKQGKAARPRSITITDAFERNMPKGKGMLSSGHTRHIYTATLHRVTTAIGREKWPKNALRHSFASYHLAQSQDASKTAYQMGHVSAQEVYQDYANAVSRADAEAWFSL